MPAPKASSSRRAGPVGGLHRRREHAVQTIPRVHAGIAGLLGEDLQEVRVGGVDRLDDGVKLSANVAAGTSGSSAMTGS